MPHHVVDVIGLNAKRDELCLEELTQGMDTEVVACIAFPFQEAGLEVQIVDDLVELLLTNLTGRCVHFVPD